MKPPNLVDELNRLFAEIDPETPEEILVGGVIDEKLHEWSET